MIKSNLNGPRAVFLVVGVLAAGPVAAENRGIALPDGQGTLVLPVPPGWTEVAQGTNAEGPAAVAFRGAGKEDFRVFVVPFAAAGGDIAEMMRDAARGIAPIAAEKQIDIEPLGDGANGYWFGYTDATLAGKAPPPGEYRYTVQGAVALGDLVATFTILTNDPASPVVVEALRMMRAARYRGGT